MSQIKHLIYAFLLLIFFATVIVFFNKLSSVELIGQKPKTVDHIDKTETKTVISNAEGKSLFSANCATCHALDKILTGPALRGVNERGLWANRRNIIAWIKNSATTIKKFAYTKDLVDQFNGQIMPSFSALTDIQIGAILDYLKQAQPVAIPDAVVMN